MSAYEWLVKKMNLPRGGVSEMQKAIEAIGPPPKYKVDIKIKYLRDIQKIEKIDIGDWVDLRAAEDIEIWNGYRLQMLSLWIQFGRGWMIGIF